MHEILISGYGWNFKFLFNHIKNPRTISRDPETRHNILFINVYVFEYIDKLLGDGIWQGVMSDEIPQSAVIKHNDGYDRVDYSQLDVEFKQI